MKILLINPSYITLSARFGTGHQIPLGLLMVGGPLLDAGHQVILLDAERRHLSVRAIVDEVKSVAPQIVMTGHAGSTSAHPVCVKMLSAIKNDCPNVITVYGGVYPSFHAEEILEKEQAVDIIARGEGEAVSLDLVDTIESKGPLHNVLGIAYRARNQVVLTPPRPPSNNLDAFRIGWELIENWDDYQCFGLGRSAIVQFSRGCPHQCTYCGQRDFWVKWRHRDPSKVVDEIEWLHRTHNVRFISLADENPTSNKIIWQSFLKELAARELQVHFFASIRATDIVRDADILHLYQQAGIQYILLGVESTEPEVLKSIKKGSTTRLDLAACRLLKQHGIFSIVAHVVGLKDETWKTFWTSIKQLIFYDGDFVNVTHVTPHGWTAFGRQVKDHTVVQPDLNKWDYRHQILEQRHLSTWKVFLAVKWLELWVHARPGRLWTILTTRDRFRRRQLLWSFYHTGLVWFGEILQGSILAFKHLLKYLKPLGAPQKKIRHSYKNINNVRHVPTPAVQKMSKLNRLKFNPYNVEPDGLIMAESNLCSTSTQPNLNLPLS